MLGTSTKRMYIGDCIIQIVSVNTLALEVVEDFGQLAVGLGVARRQQEASGWNARAGVFTTDYFNLFRCMLFCGVLLRVDLDLFGGSLKHVACSARRARTARKSELTVR